MIRYNRVPSREFLCLFKKGNILNCIIDILSSSKHPLDGQFRENDVFSVYYGMTVILKIKYKNKCLIINAADPYKKQISAKDLMASWQVNDIEPNYFMRLLKNYIDNVAVSKQWWKGEGEVQSKWSKMLGIQWNPKCECLIIDREAIICYDSIEEQNIIHRKIKANLRPFRKKIKNNHWATINEGASNELDMFGIGNDGHTIFLIEAKKGDAASKEIYYSPYQIIKYILEWEEAIHSNNKERIIGDINRLIARKKEIGLLPSNAPLIKSYIKEIIPILAIDKRKWSDEVERRRIKCVDLLNDETNGKLQKLRVRELN